MRDLALDSRPPLCRVFSVECTCGRRYAIGAFLSLDRVSEDRSADNTTVMDRRECRCGQVLEVTLAADVLRLHHALEQLAMGDLRGAQRTAMRALFGVEDGAPPQKKRDVGLEPILPPRSRP